jgi:hypothetical protein
MQASSVKSTTTSVPFSGGTASLPQSEVGTAIQEVEWLFAVLRGSRTSLHTLRIKPTQTGATVMQLLRKEFTEIMTAKRWFHLRIAIEDAIISPVSEEFFHGFVRLLLEQLCTGDPEAQDYPREVIVDRSIPRLDLTEAFHNPFILRGQNFVQLNEQFILTNNRAAINRPCHATLIKVAMNKASVALVLAVVIFLSIATGIVTGFLVKDAKIGLAVCAGAVGIFALIQGSLVGVDAMRLKAVR